MGSLHFGNSDAELVVSDRLLAHLQIAITTKLRLHQGFLLTWTIAPDLGSGRTAIWIDPSMSLHYQYDRSDMPAVNRVWVEQLVIKANSPQGIVLAGESLL